MKKKIDQTRNENAGSHQSSQKLKPIRSVEDLPINAELPNSSGYAPDTLKHDNVNAQNATQVSAPQHLVLNTSSSLAVQKHDNSVPETFPTNPQLSVEQLALAHRRAFDIESVKRRQRADSFFHSLTSEQQHVILDAFEKDEDLGTVAMRLSAPPPEGFGLNIHLNSLRRLRAHWQSVHHIMKNEEILDTIHDMEMHSDFSQHQRIQEAIGQMLHEKAFELARIAPGSDSLGRVLTGIEKLSALDYKRQKLILEHRKLLHPPPPPPNITAST